MKKQILFLFSFGNSIRLLYSFTRRLLNSDRYSLHFATGNETIARITRDVLSVENVISGFHPEIIEKVSPHLVICQEIWVGPIIRLLQTAREKNIPILMYDHGSLMFGSYFSLENNEHMASYRSDITRCSHIACWGEQGKVSWSKYGISEKKISLTGAVQYDSLYRVHNKSQFIYQKLNIPPGEKIILYYSAIGHSSTDPQWNRREKYVLSSLERFVQSNNGFRLVIKPHPLAMRDNSRPFPHSSTTIMVCTPFEEAWDNVKKIDCDELCAISYATVSSVSSVLLTPLILGIPIIHIEIDRPVCKDFSRFGYNAFFNLKKGMSIASLIKRIPEAFGPERKQEYTSLCSQLNYRNDGRASDRLHSLIDSILKEQNDQVQFYIPVEKELLKALEQFPDLPYPYQNLCLHYSETGNTREATKLFRLYNERFNQPTPLLKRMLDRYFKPKRPALEVIDFLEPLHVAYKLPSNPLLRLAQAYREAGRFDDAIKLFIILLEKEKKTGLLSILLYETGLTRLMENKHPAAAVSYFNRAIRRTRNNKELLPRIYYRLGETYLRIGQFPGARRNLKKCLTIIPGHRAAASLLASCNQTGPNRIKRFFREIKSVNIETTNRCNMIADHPYCPLNRRRETFGDCLLDINVIENLLKELHRWEFSGRLGLHHYSEPLTDKRIHVIIRMAKNLCPAAKLNIWTNGTLLTEKKAADLFDDGIQWLRISAYSDADYKKFIAWKPHLLEQFPGREITVERQTLDNRLELYNSPVLNLQKTCARIHEQLVITSMGEIQLCCFDYLCSQRFGNVNTHSLTQILEESGYLNTRTILMKGHRYKYDICSRCRF